MVAQSIAYDHNIDGRRHWDSNPLGSSGFVWSGRHLSSSSEGVQGISVSECLIEAIMAVSVPSRLHALTYFSRIPL